MVTGAGEEVLIQVELPEPHDSQLPILNSEAKRMIVRAGRRGGKTTAVAMKAVMSLINHERVLYAAPTSDQINAFWKEVTTATAPLVYNKLIHKNETRHTLEWNNDRGRIRAITAWNADTLRGDYCDLLILDEFQIMAETAWEEVGSPMLLDTNGDALFIFTPPSLRSTSATKARDPRHAAKMFKRAEEDETGLWQTHHFTSFDNPYISREALDILSSDMTNLAFRQEILAEDLTEVPGALWTRSLIDGNRRKYPETLTRVVVGVDPPGGSTECGIVVAGTGPCSCSGSEDIHGFILADYSLTASPDTWASEVVQAYLDHECDRILAESNFGGDMVNSTIQLAAAAMDVRVSYSDVRASRGKAIRAEPVAALYEQGKIHHVETFETLEDELCTWQPNSGWSPNRLDALVWSMTNLMVKRDRSGVRFIE